MTNMLIHIEDASQAEGDEHFVPSDDEFHLWTQAALQTDKTCELSIRIVNQQEMLKLNSQYRQQDKTTNVLSFPADVPDFIELETKLLGDIAICADVVNREAQEQNKTASAHWAHIVIHGCLHLQGFDHVVDSEAEKMESLEVLLLKQLGFSNPYQFTDH